MKTLRVTIAETVGGWEVRWESGALDLYRAAAEAQKAVKALGRTLADGGESNAIVITWETTTRLGRQIVRAITEA